MKRFLLVLLLFPHLLFGAFTDFYCTSTGSNLNGGSGTGAAKYTATNGGWNSGTGVYTPTTGTNPVSAGVVVGDFASVYVDGATVAVFIGRVTAVTNATNGTITVSTTAIFGTTPTTNASARSIKVGGAWLGPTGAVLFPLGVTGTNLGSATNSAADQVCVNFKNDQTYTMTAQLTFTNISGCRLQGYTTTARDGGKATFTSNVTGSVNYTSNTGFTTYQDLKFTNTGASGSSNLWGFGNANGATFVRCVFNGGRGSGFNTTSGFATLDRCEAYDNNKSNTSGLGGFAAPSVAGVVFKYCYSHDNTGSNTAGFITSGANTTAVFQNCISESNGGIGISLTGTAGVQIENCDLYNNGSDGVKDAMTQNASYLLVRNSNFFKNTGKGINVTTTAAQGEVDKNVYGAGTQANGSADTLQSLFDIGTAITYTSNLTPYNAPTTGDFSIVGTTIQGVGRGEFTETDGTNTGTVGFPDPGAAQAQVGVPFPTPTATPTATPVQTSYAFPQ